MLACYDDPAVEQLVALSRARDRMETAWGVLEDAWHAKNSTVDRGNLLGDDFNDVRQSDFAESAAQGAHQAEGAPPSEALRELEYQHGYYPRWLKRDLIDDFFPWQEAQQTLMPTLLQHYDLHDSNLVGLWLTNSGGLLAVIQWDPIAGIPEDESIDFGIENSQVDPLMERQYGDDVAYYPYLLIRFLNLYSLSVLNDPDDTSSSGHPIIWGATSNSIPDEHMTALDSSCLGTSGGISSTGSEKPQSLRYETAIEGGVRGGLRIVHGAHIAIICLNRGGRVVALPWL
jgi:hypothetical protein